MTTPREERPLQAGGVPAAEGIEQADVAQRLDLDPEEQPNATDPEQSDPQETTR